MKQTAVEWLVEQFKKSLNPYEKINMIEEAKEMEKEQIMDAHNNGHSYYEETGIDAEQYYNETFKSE